MMRPEKDAPERLYGACGLKDLAGHGRVSGKEFLSGRKRAAAKPRPGTRTALYMRVSTADQKPDLQSDDLRGYAARPGLDVVQDYCDLAVSGRREGRPQLNALMAAARNHEIACVLVWKFDRFARSARHLLAALEEFDHLGVRFVSVQDQVDTDRRSTRQAPRPPLDATTRHRRDRGARQVHGPQHPRDPEEDRRPRQPEHRRRNHQA